MKKLTSIIICFVLIVSLSSCAPQKSTKELLNAEMIEIPILIYEKSNGAIEAVKTKWNLVSGEIGKGEPVYSVADTIDTKPIFWDGNYNFIFEQLPTSYQKEKFSMKTIVPIDSSNHTILSDTFRVNVKNNFAGNSYVFYWNDNDGKEIIKEPAALKSPDSFSKQNIGQSCELLAVAKDKENALLFFLPPLDGETCEIFYVKYDLQTDDYKWFACKVPSQFTFDVATNFSTDSTIYHNGKLYMSGGTSLLYLDIQKNEILALEDIVSSAKQLIPNSSQTNLMNLTPPISLAGIFNDVIIFYLPVYEKQGKNHGTFFAMRNDKIIGAIDIADTNINIYNQNLKLINEIKQGKDKLSNIKISFPWRNIIYYGNLN